MHIQNHSNYYLNSYYSLFVNRNDVWFKQTNDGKNYTCQRAIGSTNSVTLELINAHLSGDLTCGWTDRNENQKTKWIAWDSDGKFGHLDQIEEILRSLNLKPHREGRRLGRDGHLWIFLDSPISRKYAQRFDLWVKEILLSEYEINATKMEFFPKATKDTEIGNCLRGPLGIHRKAEAAGSRGYFDEAAPALEEQLIWLTNLERDRTENILKLVNNCFNQDIAKPDYRILRTNHSRKRFNILDYLQSQDLKLSGDRYKTQCPCCLSEGHDRSHDNLHVALDGAWYACWFGGHNSIHTFEMIEDVLRNSPYKTEE
jgi:hypothetical protein